MDSVASEVLALRHHLIQHLGQPRSVVELSGNPNPSAELDAVQVAHFSPGGDQKTQVFCTVGGVVRPLRDRRRVEGLVLTNKAPDEALRNSVTRLLGAFMLLPENQVRPVRPGDIIRAEQELQGASKMDAIICLPPMLLVPEFHFAPLKSGRAELLWLLPIYPEEAEYILKHGPHVLLTIAAASGNDLTDFARERLDTTLSPEDAAEAARERLKQLPDAQAAAPAQDTQSKVATQPAGAPPAKTTSPRAGPAPRSSRPGPRAPKPKGPNVTQVAPNKKRVQFDLSASARGTPAKAPTKATPPKAEKSRAPTKEERVQKLKSEAQQVQERARERRRLAAEQDSNT